MSDVLPDPLVPADVDLRGLEYMPFFGNHLFGSEFNARCSDSEWRAGVTLWWAAWNQVPAGSLPNDDVALTRLADLGRDVKGWRKAKARALHGFILCSDGRLYHRFLAQQALVAWDKRMAERGKSRAEADRKRRERERRSRMFEQLRAVNVTPEWNTTTAELERLVTQHVTDESRGRDSPVTPPVTRDSTPPVTAKTGRDGTGRESTPTTNTVSAYSTSPTVALAVALRASGVGNASASNPDVLRWAEDGVTIEEAQEAVRIAIEERRKPKPSTGYLVGIIRDLRNPRAAANGHGPSGTAKAIAALEELKGER